MKIHLPLLWSLILMSSTPALAHNLIINITNIKPEKSGQLLVMVFEEQGFPKQHEKAIEIKTLTGLTPTMQVSFELTQDTVAIKVLHDEDSNGKVTKNWTGIWPREGLGFSNQQKVGLTGVPRFQASKIELASGNNQHTVELRYP